MDDGGFSYKFTQQRGGGSNLMNLFSQEDKIRGQGNSSLRYTAPDQNPSANSSVHQQASPEGERQPETTANDAPLVYACPINLIKYDENRQAQNLEARAMAILYSPGTRKYSFVCYHQQTQVQDASMEINNGFNLTVHPGADRYVSFFDNQKKYWCIQFADELSKETTLTHFVMVKAADNNLMMDASKPKPLLIQDLQIGSSSDKETTTGDSVKMRYSIYLANNQPRKLGQLVATFGAEKAKVGKIGDGKEIQGIDQGLRGMKKGSKRLLVIPPQLAYGSQESEKIPSNSTIAVQLEVMKVRYADEEKSKKKEKKKR